MGSKTIIFLGILLSALYLYFCISKQTVVAPIANVVEEVKPTPTEPAVVVPEVEEEVKPTEPVAEENVTNNVIERISTPAFGFMAGVEKNQIVALMSDNDENGALSKEIEALCKKRECSKDMRYENDIKDAAWQSETVDIIKLFTDGSIENGSLFIESDVLKIEGKIKDQKTQTRLDEILNGIKSGMKVENHSKLSEGALKNNEAKKVEPIPAKEVIVKKVEPTKVVEKEVVVERVAEPAPIPIQIPIEELEKKVEPKPVVIKKVTPKPVAKPKPVHKPTVSKPVAVPAPVMETTLDAEARVRAILSEIKEAGSEVGVVAKPHMETTAE